MCFITYVFCVGVSSSCTELFGSMINIIAVEYSLLPTKHKSKTSTDYSTLKLPSLCCMRLSFIKSTAGHIFIIALVFGKALATISCDWSKWF